MTVAGVSQWFWQYQCNNLLVFERDAATYLLLPGRSGPATPWDPRPRTITMERLPALRWRMRAPERDLASRYACGFALTQDPAKYEAARPAIAEMADTFGEEEDLAPMLHADLQSLAGDPDERL